MRPYNRESPYVRDYSKQKQIYKCQRIQKGQSTMDNLEKLATQGLQDEDKQNKHMTQYVLGTTKYTQAKTNNVNKTIALLQITGGLM